MCEEKRTRIQKKKKKKKKKERKGKSDGRASRRSFEKKNSRKKMCPRAAPISKAGKAAASAAVRFLRAFEAELAPVVEALTPPGAMVTCPFFNGLSSI